MLFEKAAAKMCPECGEDMQLARDFGPHGEEYDCVCGFSEETIDLTHGVAPVPHS